MSIFCIVLAVFLVTAIFGMADMYIRSQLLQARKDFGDSHIGIRDITDEEAAPNRRAPRTYRRPVWSPELPRRRRLYSVRKDSHPDGLWPVLAYRDESLSSERRQLSP